MAFYLAILKLAEKNDVQRDLSPSKQWCKYYVNIGGQ